MKLSHSMINHWYAAAVVSRAMFHWLKAEDASRVLISYASPGRTLIWRGDLNVSLRGGGSHIFCHTVLPCVSLWTLTLHCPNVSVSNQLDHGVILYLRRELPWGPQVSHIIWQMRKWKLRGRKYLAKCTQPVSSTVWGTPSLLRYSTLPSGGDCPQVLSHPMTDPQTTRPSPSSARWSEYKPTIATYRKVSLVHQHLRALPVYHQWTQGFSSASPNYIYVTYLLWNFIFPCLLPVLYSFHILPQAYFVLCPCLTSPQRAGT